MGWAARMNKTARTNKTKTEERSLSGYEMTDMHARFLESNGFKLTERKLPMGHVPSLFIDIHHIPSHGTVENGYGQTEQTATWALPDGARVIYSLLDGSVFISNDPVSDSVYIDEAVLHHHCETMNRRVA